MNDPNRCFLLIDQHMNTALIPYSDEDIVEFFRRKPGFPDNLEKVQMHDTIKALDQDVRRYLRGTYEERKATT
jgi:hypothetical protein